MITKYHDIVTIVYLSFQGYGGFTGFHASMVLLYLLRQRKLNHFMSSYQVFRIFLQFLGNALYVMLFIMTTLPSQQQLGRERDQSGR